MIPEKSKGVDFCHTSQDDTACDRVYSYDARRETIQFIQGRFRYRVNECGCENGACLKGAM